MNEIQVINNKEIESMIYVIRGKEVMFDCDLAKLYQCKNGTKDVNKAVNRNIERFPKDFYFQLTKEEYDNLKFQNGTSRFNSHGGVRKVPYVFTEQGVAMLASVLKTNIASSVSVDIMRAFVLMRHFLIENQDIFKSLVSINSKLDMHEEKINYLFSKFETKDLNEKIFFDGEIYDAYSKIIDIMNQSKREVIIIDNYADKTVLDIISKMKVEVILVVKIKSLLKDIDIQKYNEQYHNLKIVYNDSFHDRFIILDRREIYHSGTSLNKAGNKTFAINKINEENLKSSFIEYINNILNDTL